MWIKALRLFAATIAISHSIALPSHADGRWPANEGSVLSISLSEAVSEFIWSPELQWLQSDSVVTSLMQSNQRSEYLEETEMVALDTAWKDALSNNAGKPLATSSFVSSVRNSTLSGILKQYQSSTDNLIADIFLLNDRGFCVGMTRTVSSYWHGRQENFQTAYSNGTVHITQPFTNRKTGQSQVLVSVPVIHPFNMEIIGAVVFVMNTDHLHVR